MTITKTAQVAAIVSALAASTLLAETSGGKIDQSFESETVGAAATGWSGVTIEETSYTYDKIDLPISGSHAKVISVSDTANYDAATKGSAILSGGANEATVDLMFKAVRSTEELGQTIDDENQGTLVISIDSEGFVNVGHLYNGAWTWEKTSSNLENDQWVRATFTINYQSKLCRVLIDANGVAKNSGVDAAAWHGKTATGDISPTGAWFDINDTTKTSSSAFGGITVIGATMLDDVVVSDQYEVVGGNQVAVSTFGNATVQMGDDGAKDVAVPVKWLLTYDLSTASTTAANNMSVAQCYLAGISPVDATAKFTIESFTVSGSGTQATFTVPASVNGKATIYSKDGSGEWTAAGTQNVTANGTITVDIAPADGQSVRYFKVTVAP
ncbi:MAG: hypothetical protein IJ802_06025 [Kiritimatiellae bacterium]|nr:hypothetical protein [Kiritimatiellia bacterium]